MTLHQWANKARDQLARIDAPSRAIKALLKQFAEVSAAISANQAGRGQGRKRTLDHDKIVTMKAEGATSQQIAKEIGCAASTVDVTLSRLRKKQGPAMVVPIEPATTVE